MPASVPNGLWGLSIDWQEEGVRYNVFCLWGRGSSQTSPDAYIRSRRGGGVQDPLKAMN